MLNKIKNLIILTIGTLTLLMPVAVTATVGFASADCQGIANNIEQGVSDTIPANGTGSGSGTNAGGGCGTIIGNTTTGSLGSIAKTVVNLFSLLVGIVSVIMIIYGGFRYITSGGESGAVGNAKNTIIYAIIGLVIVALAQVIVHFVLNAALNGTVSSTT
jgi:uncharacterized membrane protein